MALVPSCSEMVQLPPERRQNESIWRERHQTIHILNRVVTFGHHIAPRDTYSVLWNKEGRELLY